MIRRSYVSQPCVWNAAAMSDPGYVVLRGAVDKDQVVRFAPGVGPSSNVFNGHDGKRTTRVASMIMIDILSDVLKEIGLLTDTWRISDTSIITSVPGCGHQEAHTDYDVAFMAKLPHTLLPYSVLLGAGPGCSIVTVWPNSTGMHRKMSTKPAAKIEPVHVVLGAGDLLIMRGDLYHAGGAYPLEHNTRVHTFLEPQSAPHDHARTYRAFKDPVAVQFIQEDSNML